MPIGTIDYISSAPWNDAFNPWPQYAQVALSAADIPLATLDMDAFNPANLNLVAGTNVLRYVSGDGLHELYYLKGIDNGAYWEVNYDGGTAVYSQSIINEPGVVAARALPVKSVGSALGWISNGAPIGDVNALFIQPVYSYLTPWEFRRRRLLEMC